MHVQDCYRNISTLLKGHMTKRNGNTVYLYAVHIYGIVMWSLFCVNYINKNLYSWHHNNGCNYWKSTHWCSFSSSRFSLQVSLAAVSRQVWLLHSRQLCRACTCFKSVPVPTGALKLLKKKCFRRKKYGYSLISRIQRSECF